MTSGTPAEACRARIADPFARPAALSCLPTDYSDVLARMGGVPG